MKRYFLVILFIMPLFILAGCIQFKDCGEDKQCFKGSIENCERAVVMSGFEGITLKSTIRGENGYLCEVSFKIEGLDEEIKSNFPTEASIAQGKTLNCDLDINRLKRAKKLEELFRNYGDCGGPLKDAFENYDIQPELKGRLSMAIEETLLQ